MPGFNASGNELKMKKITLTTILAIIILFMIACKPVEEPYPISDKDFKKGTEGLTFEFIQNAPPDKTYEDTIFEIHGRIYNKGAYTADEGYITAIVASSYLCIYDGSNCVVYQTEGHKEALDELRIERAKIISDIDQLLNGEYIDADDEEQRNEKIITLRQEKENIDEKIRSYDDAGIEINPAITKEFSSLEPPGLFEGRSIYAPEGTNKYVEFDAKARLLDALAEQHTTQVILTSCYKYYTEVTEEICIDADPASLKDKVCTTRPIELNDQGAPIAITSIEPKILPKQEGVELQLNIFVENKGDGQIVASDKLKEACSAAKLSRQDWNEITVKEVRFGKFTYTEGEDCEPNPIHLGSGDNYFKCKIKDNDITKETPAFESLVYIKLEYGYSESLSKTIVVEKNR